MNYCPSRPIKETCTVKVIITPHYDNVGISHLSIRMVLSSPNCAAFSPLLLYETFYGNVRAYPYKPTDISASDSSGPLSLNFTFPETQTQRPRPGIAKIADADADQEWRPGRATSGDVTLRFDVYPRTVDITPPLDPRVDLRRDQGGLVGVGRWFLPRPALEREGGHGHCFGVEWDLSEAAGRDLSPRAVWSFGEGPEAVYKSGSTDVLINSVFMVGPVRSHAGLGYLDPTCFPAEAEIYWFGELPGNLERLNEYNVQLFPKLAGFFGTPGAEYRIFIRKVVRGFGGGAYRDSYVLEYDDSSWKETDEELVGLFSHEMIHSFTMMALEPHLSGYDNSWYNEGIAQFYSAYLPYRHTGPVRQINMNVLQAQRMFCNDWYAELIPYMRGCAYLLQIDSRLRKKMGRFGLSQNSPLDDIVIDMAARSRRGEQLQIRDWLEYLRPLESDIYEEFKHMLTGKIVLDLSDTIVISHNCYLAPQSQEMLEFGFDKSSIAKRVISGVVPGSRAARAGLENGDRLLSMTRAGISSTDLSARMDLRVEKDDEEVNILYWPRSFKTARIWQLEQL